MTVIICGDFNAWNVEWRSRVSNPRGLLLSDFTWSLGIIHVNRGSSPTFTRGEAVSVIDIIYYRNLSVTGWRILD